ncbi:MAG: putative rane protein [Candidatus Berkelbacteria bacterium]|nr:putative rane protein [Candidatus Berkelbacteria bacterium]
MDSRLLATIIIFPIWLTLVLVFRRHRQWLFYYLIAAFGFTIQLVFLAEHFGLDQTAILESSIIFSLLIFYPLFSLRQRILRVIFGLVVTYVINILRLMIIVLMAYKFGPDYIFIAHAGVARIFFFICELLLYWFLMTKPSAKSVGDSINDNSPISQTARSGHSLRWRNTYAQGFIILMVLGLSLASFQLSNDWQKTFVKSDQPRRPIIYQDETDLTKQTQSKDNQILGEQSQVIHSAALKNIQPNQEITYDLTMDNFGLINIVMSEANAPFRIDVYINNEFTNNTIVKGHNITIDRRLFEKGFEVNQQDLVRLKIQNLGNQNANYLIKFEEYK